MPMNGPLLGVALDVAANVSNPAAAVLSAPIWLLNGTAWVTGMQTALVKPLGLVAPSAGGPLTGQGSVTGMVASAMGAILAASTGPAAPFGLSHWTAIAQAFITYVTGNATVSPGTLQAPAGTPTSGGPVTGAGVIGGLSASTLGNLLNVAAGTAVSPAALASWNAMATQLIAQLSIAAAGGSGLLCPPGGGPITGAGTIL